MELNSKEKMPLKDIAIIKRNSKMEEEDTEKDPTTIMIKDNKNLLDSMPLTKTNSLI